MKILVVNDDGIMADGIKHLAKMAAHLGEVWVVAPATQCSAMSQRITVFGDLEVKRISYSVEEIMTQEEKTDETFLKNARKIHAYSVSGTPADCVKVALMYLTQGKPDVVFSGINHGYNAGHDILYSGTIGACVEALSEGVPAMAFSNKMFGSYDVVEKCMLSLTKELMQEKISASCLWNINFPGCPLEEYKGVLRQRKIAPHQLYLDHYNREDQEGEDFILHVCGTPTDQAEPETDIRAVLDGYISIGVIESAVLRDSFS